MRVAIVGLGGVGGYITAKFAQANVDVVGFARGEHLNAIQKNGIKIIEDELEWSQKIDARELNAADGHFDIVLFCVKSYDLEESYLSIKNSTDKNTIFISFSNGVSNADKLKEFGAFRVLEGCVYILSHIVNAGEIRKKGKVFAAIFGGDEEATQILSSLFEKAKLRHKTPSDIQTAIWKKYIFISAFATLTSYYDKSIGYVYKHHKDEVQVLLNEIAAFAKTKGIEIQDEVSKAFEVASNVPYDSTTSMYLDFKNKKRVELESLSGYVKMPLMIKLYTKLKRRV